MRGDQIGAIAADQDPPRVLSNQPTDHLGIVVGVVRVVTHGPLILSGRAGDTRSEAARAGAGEKSALVRLQRGESSTPLVSVHRGEPELSGTSGLGGSDPVSLGPFAQWPPGARSPEDLGMGLHRPGAGGTRSTRPGAEGVGIRRRPGPIGRPVRQRGVRHRRHRHEGRPRRGFALAGHQSARVGPRPPESRWHLRSVLVRAGRPVQRSGHAQHPEGSPRL